jgi:hypothetical protein
MRIEPQVSVWLSQEWLTMKACHVERRSSGATLAPHCVRCSAGEHLALVATETLHSLENARSHRPDVLREGDIHLLSSLNIIAR